MASAGNFSLNGDNAANLIVSGNRVCLLQWNVNLGSGFVPDFVFGVFIGNKKMVPVIRKLF